VKVLAGKMPSEQRMSDFSGEAFKAFDLARQIAKEMKHGSVEIGHLLLALKQTENSIAQYILNKLTVNEQRIKDFIEHHAQPDRLESGKQPIPSISLGVVFELAEKEALKEANHIRKSIIFIMENTQYDLPPDVRQVLELASVRSACIYPPVSTDHVLIGAARRSKGTDSDVLELMGIDLDRLRQLIHLVRIRKSYLF
jgi:hypothetical protein